MTDNRFIFCSPMQGYTDYTWRNAHARVYGNVDAYVAPFMRVERGEIRQRDIKDILPANNTVDCLLPQILAGKPEETVKMATCLKELGYTHININMGCPHPPVANKHKGAGILKYPDEIEGMFNALSEIDGMSFSVKMRLGWDETNQWEKMIDLFDIIKPEHITVHPRTGKQQYKGELDVSEFKRLVDRCKYPIIYNGGIGSIKDIENINVECDKLYGVMIGSALIAHPYLLNEGMPSANDLVKFHDLLLDGYRDRLGGGDTQLLIKMKSFWELFLPQADRKLRKQIKKCHSIEQYSALSNEAILSIENSD